MKTSKFNSTISISDKYNLHYNSFFDSFLLSKKDYEISLDKQGEELQTLIKNGFIVDKSVDENKKLRERSDSIILQDNSFRLTINPTLDCNFSCWYCYEEKLKKSRMDEQTLHALRKLLSNLAKKYDNLHISFFGGEPFLQFKDVIVPIYEYIEFVCQKNDCTYTTSYTTNGGLISNKILDYLEDKSVSNMQITIDGGEKHHNKTRYYANKKGSYRVILANIAKLLRSKISVTVRINYTPDNIDSLKEVADDLLNLLHIEDVDKLLVVRLHQVWQTTEEDLTSEVDAVVEYLCKHGIRALKPVFNNVISPCYADFKNSALINYNGDVFKCTAVDFLNAERDGYLKENGEIVWENNSLEKRVNSKFKNKACNDCRIQPICNGGCSQKALQFSSKNYCILNFDESRKDQIIKDRFVAHLQENNLEKKFEQKNKVK